MANNIVIISAILWVLLERNTLAFLLEKSKFESEIRHYKDVLGGKEFQNYYEILPKKIIQLEGKSILSSFNQRLTASMKMLKQFADNIVTVAENVNEHFPSQPDTKSCCSPHSYTKDFKFNKRVDPSTGCHFVSNSDDGFPPLTMVDVMKSNLISQPSLFWQHFSTEKGTKLVYPSVDMWEQLDASCRISDPRFDPFYRAGSSIVPKDVVVIIKATSSMFNTYLYGSTRISVAKQVASTVLKTLGPSDRTTVFSYGKETKMPSICKDSGFKFIHDLDGHYDELLSFVNTMELVLSPADMSLAIRTAFKFFVNETEMVDSAYRKKVILLIGDDNDPSENPTILDVISEENGQVENKVIIMAIDLRDGGDSPFLRSIVNQANNNGSFGTVKQGEVIRFTDVSDIRSSLTPWYSYFRVTGSGENHAFSTPYIDMFSKHGLVTSLCRPAYRSNRLVGVACIEAKISELFSDTTSFHENGNSYAFVIDQFGRTIKHPLLQLPRTIRAEKASRHIFTVEREMSMRPALENMMKRQTGSVNVTNKYVIKARGVVHMNGVIVNTEPRVNISYIPILGSPYSVAVVLNPEDTKVTVVTNARLPKSDISECFLYHQHKKYNPYDIKLCQHYGRLATKDKSAVLFNARAFSDPAYLLNKEWSTADVQDVTKYFTQAIYPSHYFKTGVKEAVQASYKLNQIWKERENSTRFTIWQYFASTEGFMRNFPGHELSKNYDFETRPWFLQSKAKPHKTIIAPPYQDAGGAGWISGIYQTINKTSQAGRNESEIAGVLGADIGVEYLHYRLKDIYPECRKVVCMLIDDAGFLVLHPFFIQTHDKERDIKNAHIVSQEQYLSRLLLQHGIMDRRSCTDFDIDKIIYWYYLEVKYGQSQILGDNEFEIHPIEGSNIFLIAKFSSREDYCCAETVWSDPAITPCPQSGLCTCLCYDPLKLCNTNIESFLDNHNNGPPVTCPSPSPDFSDPIHDDLTTDIPRCFKMPCTLALNSSACNVLAGCSWCESHNQTLMAQPCCQTQSVCPWGIVPATDTCPASGGCKCVALKQTSPHNVASDLKQTNGFYTTIIFAMGGVIGVFLIVISVLSILKIRNKCQQQNPKSVYLTATDENFVPRKLSGDFAEISLDSHTREVQGQSGSFDDFAMIEQLNAVDFKVTDRHEIEKAKPHESYLTTITLKPADSFTKNSIFR